MLQKKKHLSGDVFTYMLQQTIKMTDPSPTNQLNKSSNIATVIEVPQSPIHSVQGKKEKETVTDRD